MNSCIRHTEYIPVVYAPASPYRNFVDARDRDLPRASPRISRANGGVATPFVEGKGGEGGGSLNARDFLVQSREIRFLFEEKEKILIIVHSIDFLSKGIQSCYGIY